MQALRLQALAAVLRLRSISFCAVDAINESVISSLFSTACLPALQPPHSLRCPSSAWTPAPALPALPCAGSITIGSRDTALSAAAPGSSLGGSLAFSVRGLATHQDADQPKQHSTHPAIPRYSELKQQLEGKGKAAAVARLSDLITSLVSKGVSQHAAECCASYIISSSQCRASADGKRVRRAVQLRAELGHETADMVLASLPWVLSGTLAQAALDACLQALSRAACTASSQQERQAVVDYLAARLHQQGDAPPDYGAAACNRLGVSPARPNKWMASSQHKTGSANLENVEHLVAHLETMPTVQLDDIRTALRQVYGRKASVKRIELRGQANLALLQKLLCLDQQRAEATAVRDARVLELHTETLRKAVQHLLQLLSPVLGAPHAQELLERAPRLLRHRAASTEAKWAVLTATPQRRAQCITLSHGSLACLLLSGAKCYTRIDYLATSIGRQDFKLSSVLMASHSKFAERHPGFEEWWQAQQTKASHAT